jgi:hypothetical protein
MTHTRVAFLSDVTHPDSRDACEVHPMGGITVHRRDSAA